MYYSKKKDDVFKELNTSENGLTKEEAQVRQKRYGFNILEEKKKISPWMILLRQYKSFLVYILLAAVLISIFLEEYIDAAVIAVILIANGVLGFIQEYKAEKAIEALKKLASLKAKVLRDGKETEIDTKYLVPGDIIMLEEGDKIPADARVIESVNLETHEASLTGESTPVSKADAVLKDKTAVADQKNMVFSSTAITKGRGRAIVTGTGMHTEIGKIAKMIQEQDETMTPLQVKMQGLGRWIGMLIIVVCLIVFTAGALRTGDYSGMFLVAVALAVAAIPEGLPAVVTISLGLGVQRMIRRHALVRKLPSVETLGSTTVICSDKTGTLTRNEMTVTKIFANNEEIDVSGRGYSIDGKFSTDPGKIALLLRIGLLCNDANLDQGKVIGDPTEGCLLVSAGKAGMDKKKIEAKFPRVKELPFDSGRKLMTTVHRIDHTFVAYTKGAPDQLLERCNKVYMNGKILALDGRTKEKILEANDKFAKDALRVLGFACKFVDDITEVKEEDLIFVGLQGMIDPPRMVVKKAVAECKEAGVKVVVITGDHKLTAVAIANRLGITGKAITGKELDEIKNLEEVVDDISIYARVSPENKMMITKALKKKGHIVAMTGDGVNDAPALKAADIGVAMGITGTDVSKEASDMVLTDDNFASIVNAVEEGRGVYDNIKKFFAFLISGNIGEVLIIFLAIMFGMPVPMTATQILLINLVTDGLPAVALGADPFEPNAMKRKPRSKKEPIYRGLNHFIIWYPLIMITVALGLFYIVLNDTGNLVKAQTVVFLTVAMFELYQAFSSRSTRYSSFKVGIFKNKFLILAVLVSFLVTMAVIYTPLLQGWFDTAALTLKDLITVILISSLGFIYLELYKWLKPGDDRA